MGIDVYQQVTDRIIEALEQGTVPWRNPILGGQGAGWPKNLTTDRPYRGSNVFLLAMTAWAEGYRSPYWLTFKQASQRGITIKKGSKSTLVVFWKQLVVEDEESKQKKKVPVLRYYRVFNLEQCEGTTLPPEVVVQQEPTEAFSPIEAAEQIVSTRISDKPHLLAPSGSVFGVLVRIAGLAGSRV